jgi:hypothetical protein
MFMRFCLITFALLLAAAPHAQAPQAPAGRGQANYVVGSEDVLAVTVFNEAQLSAAIAWRTTGTSATRFSGASRPAGPRWPKWPPR